MNKKALKYIDFALLARYL